MIRLAAALGALGALFLLAVACASSDAAAPIDPESCATLANRCHGIADPLAAECHELGHGGDPSKCSPRLRECVAVCPEREGGTDLPFRDAGLQDASDAGPDPTCIAYCDCMKAHCATVTNYPFTDESVCSGACATYTEPERACFTDFCRQAVDAGVRAHACDHATGKLGTLECR